MRSAVITVGLGFGDEGKGATVDYLCRKYNADLVVRYNGGPQCGHNVVLPDGRSHTFAQFGSGTLAGVKTYVLPSVIISPGPLEAEARHLTSLGVSRIKQQIVFHPKCLVSTVYHHALNRLKEIKRGIKQHGSCGLGVGETRAYWLDYGNDAVRAEDLLGDHFGSVATLQEKLELLRQRFLQKAQGQGIDVDCYALLHEPAARVAREMRGQFADYHISRHAPEWERAVFEGAQGMLLDEWRGFHPYTTWSDITTRYAREFLDPYGSAVKITTLGITRTYTTRHGAGPFPTEMPSLGIKDEKNPTNRWQGGFRVGLLDMPLLRYAAKVAGSLDGLAVNHWDQYPGKIVSKYNTALEILDNPPAEVTLKQMGWVGNVLSCCLPEEEELTPQELEKQLGQIAPIYLKANGPTWEDRQELHPVLEAV